MRGSVYFAGAMLPGWSFAQTRPCPPPVLGVTGGAQVSISCAGPGSGNAPAWFLELPERKWTKIAHGESYSGAEWLRGKRFWDVVPGHPGDHIGALQVLEGVNNEGPAAVFDDWTGACVDQERKELVLAANGGHGGYPGNEVYVLKLGQAKPGYERLCDPTPRFDPANPAREWWRYDQLTYAGGGAGWNDDFQAPATYGRMRAVHGWNRVAFGGGKVWYLAQESYVSASGGGHAASVWSFDRDWVQSWGEFPLRHRVGQNPWTLHSSSPTRSSVDWSALKGGADFLPDPSVWFAHPAVYDPASRRVYTFSRAKDGEGNAVCWYVDTATGRVITLTAKIPWAAYAGGWGACAYGLDGGPSLFFCPLMEDPLGRIQVWNLGTNQVAAITPENAAFTKWTDPRFDYQNPAGTPIDSTAHPGGHGAVFHKASRSILVYSVGAQAPGAQKVGLGTKVRRLRIPRDPMAGTYRWEDIAAHPDSVVPEYCKNGCNSKFNIVEDMGNGQSCLVLASNQGAAYVYKLPNQDF